MINFHGFSGTSVAAGRRCVICNAQPQYRGRNQYTAREGAHCRKVHGVFLSLLPFRNYKIFIIYACGDNESNRVGIFFFCMFGLIFISTLESTN
jgi:hypothetical protein